MRAQSASHYDAIYADPNSRYRGAWTDAPWAPLWRAAARLIPTHADVADLGCGPGHFYECLVSSGWDADYYGQDFSAEAIRQARSRPRGPGNAWFVCGDITGSASSAYPGSVVVMLEVLEHMDDDLGLLALLPSGAPIVFSVPSFGGEGHVRHFASEADVEDRYRDGVRNWSCEVVPLRPGRCWFLVSGAVW